jgi:hypothetical protein
MEPIRSRYLASHLSNLCTGWLVKRRGVARKLPLKQEHAKVRLAKLPLRSINADSQPSVVDYLDVNAELSYTTVVEGLEEFLYQKELPPRV